MTAATQPPSKAASGVGRFIVYRTRGQAHGPIVRLVSPSDVGNLLKPFVFLDLIDTKMALGQQGSGWHPHSGIATLTLAMEGRGYYAESLGHEGNTVAGDVEWLSAGHGVWHSGHAEPPIKGFQLWIALPPERELTPAFSQHLSAADIPSDGPARVLIGRSGDAVSPVDAPAGITYLEVQLKAGERWTYRPPLGFKVGWVAVMSGAVLTPEVVEKGELAVFNPTDEPIIFGAVTDVRFVLGAAIPHDHELRLGNYSVHTSAEALAEGEREIVRIGQRLRAEGVLR